MVICLERGVDLHITKLMPLPLTVSCFSKIQIGFTFLVPAHLCSPGQRAVKRMSVCVCVCVCVCVTGMRSLLLVSRGADLRLVSLDVSYYIDVVLPVSRARIRNAVAADFDPLTGQPPTQLSLSLEDKFHACNNLLCNVL